MRPYVIALVCAFALVGELAATSSDSLAWALYKSQHGKFYEGQEDTMRFANFLARKQFVERHNADSAASYKMELNHMADWSSDEFQRLNGLKPTEAQKVVFPSIENAQTSEKLSNLPAEVDWRKVPGRVSEVKDQGQCGSCWAFATTGLLEGAQKVFNKTEFIPLSEQDLVDCSESNNGCDGGLMIKALDDISQRLGGINSEADYKYEGKKSSCRDNKVKFVMKINGGTFLEQGKEDQLVKSLANYGPVAVGIDATENLMNYKSGVFADTTCTPKGLNHGVLVVGYGVDAKDGDYWIIKNSWGPKWGEKGYFRMKRGVNMCGVAQMPTLAY